MKLDNKIFLLFLSTFPVLILLIYNRLVILQKLKKIDPFGIIFPSLIILIFPFIFTKILIIGVTLENLSKVTPILTLIGLIIAWLTYRRNQNIHNDKMLLEQAILSLERAYDVLTDKKQSINPPNNNRLNWLTSARFILRYKKLKSSLKVDVYKTICEQQEEYWRHQFFLLTQDEKKYNIDYFSQNQQIGFDHVNWLNPKSLVVIFSFSKWNPKNPDPLDEINPSKYLDNDLLPKNHQDLKTYIDNYNELYIQALKQNKVQPNSDFIE